MVRQVNFNRLYSLMNKFKGFFGILSHHLIEGLRSQKLWCIIANLFLGLWSNGVVIFYKKTKLIYVSNKIFWKNQILLLSIFGSANILENKFFWRNLNISSKLTWHISKKSSLVLFLGSEIDKIKFAIFSNFWGPQSNDGSIYQKFPRICSLDYKSLLNFTCLTMKFHNYHHASK